MTVAVRTTTATVDRAVYDTDRHASVNLVYHSQHGRPRRREENRIEYAAVNLKRNFQQQKIALDVLYYWSYTDRHKASSGLSARAELFVWFTFLDRIFPRLPSRSPLIPTGKWQMGCNEKLRFWFLNSFGSGTEVQKYHFFSSPSWTQLHESNTAEKLIYLSKKESCLILAG